MKVSLTSDLVEFKNSSFDILIRGGHHTSPIFLLFCRLLRLNLRHDHVINLILSVCHRGVHTDHGVVEAADGGAW